jgi:septal ring factor EnvC (AmiA/AmiB activator)
VAQKNRVSLSDRVATARPEVSLAAETLRQAACADAAVASVARPEEKFSLFWRVFGGTLLSIAAMACITVYTQFSGSLHDLRDELNRIHETHADFLKKEEFTARTTGIWSALNLVNGELPALKTRSAVIENQLQASESERKELQKEVQQLRERLAAVEGRQAVKATTAKDPPP